MDWLPITMWNIEAHWGREILVRQANGIGYFGIATDVTTEYLEIANGDCIQRARFNMPAMFLVVTPPPLPSYRLADSRLKL